MAHLYAAILSAWDTALRDLWKRSSLFYKSKVTQGSEAVYDVYNKDDIMISDNLQEQVIPDIKPEKQPRPKKPKTYPATDEQRAYAERICKDRDAKLVGYLQNGIR